MLSRQHRMANTGSDGLLISTLSGVLFPRVTAPFFVILHPVYTEANIRRFDRRMAESAN